MIIVPLLFLLPSFGLDNLLELRSSSIAEFVEVVDNVGDARTMSPVFEAVEGSLNVGTGRPVESDEIMADCMCIMVLDRIVLDVESKSMVCQYVPDAPIMLLQISPGGEFVIEKVRRC